MPSSSFAPPSGDAEQCPKFDGQLPAEPGEVLSLCLTLRRDLASILYAVFASVKILTMALCALMEMILVWALGHPNLIGFMMVVSGLTLAFT